MKTLFFIISIVFSANAFAQKNYTLKFVDYKTNEPLSGISFQVCRHKFPTDCSSTMTTKKDGIALYLHTSTWGQGEFDIRLVTLNRDVVLSGIYRKFNGNPTVIRIIDKSEDNKRKIKSMEKANQLLQKKYDSLLKNHNKVLTKLNQAPIKFENENSNEQNDSITKKILLLATEIV